MSRMGSCETGTWTKPGLKLVYEIAKLTSFFSDLMDEQTPVDYDQHGEKTIRSLLFFAGKSSASNVDQKIFFFFYKRLLDLNRHFGDSM